MRGYLFCRDEKEYDEGRDFIENKQHAHSKGSPGTLELGIKEFEEGRKEAEKTWKGGENTCWKGPSEGRWENFRGQSYFTKRLRG